MLNRHMIGGMAIVSHPLVVTQHWEVRRHPIKKRRRNWRVVRVERPGCWMVGDTLYAHPDLIEHLKKEFAC